MSDSTTTVGVPREVKTDEHRVAITPDGVHEMVNHGVAVVVESGAGDDSSITDDDYRARGGRDRRGRRIGMGTRVDRA